MSSTILEKQNFGLAALFCLVIGSMMGGALFAVPSEFASVSAPYPMLIGWCITGVGVLLMAFSYHKLAMHKPHLNGGIFIYSKEAFSNYIGFNSAIGYWVSAILGNVSFIVLLGTTLKVYFSDFNPVYGVKSILWLSLFMWGIHFLCIRGFKNATSLNILIVVAELIPAVIFIGFAIHYFNLEQFQSAGWGEQSKIGSPLVQIKHMMLLTVWEFIGIEGAAIFSQRAKKRIYIGISTVSAIIALLILLLCISLLPFGLMEYSQVTNLKEPSMAGALEVMIGPIGLNIVRFGFIISVFGALISWTLLGAEIMFLSARNSCLPKIFGNLNKYNSPNVSMWATTILTQIILISTYFYHSGYLFLLLLASALILVPYFLSALYFVKILILEKHSSKFSISDQIVAWGSLAYTTWLLYSSGITALVDTCILYAVSVPIYFYMHKKQNFILTKKDKIIAICLIIISVIAIVKFV